MLTDEEGQELGLEDAEAFSLTTARFEGPILYACKFYTIGYAKLRKNAATKLSAHGR
jgi:hypothetical protein